MKEVELSAYKRTYPSQGRICVFLWMLISTVIFRSNLYVPNSLKVMILRYFGAKIKKGVIIKPGVNIKYPWKLNIGNNCWIGEGVWIDNLARVTLKDNVCISQGAMLLTGSHDYKKSTFNLRLGKIFLERGVWICAKSIVCPGVVCRTNSVLSVGSIATHDLECNFIYQGNPAEKKRKRTIS